MAMQMLGRVVVAGPVNEIRRLYVADDWRFCAFRNCLIQPGDRFTAYGHDRSLSLCMQCAPVYKLPKTVESPAKLRNSAGGALSSPRIAPQNR